MALTLILVIAFGIVLLIFPLPAIKEDIDKDKK